MSDELTRIFAECMDGIEADRLTASECLARYPQYRAELGELLQVASEMQAMPSVRPSKAMRQQSQAHLLANLPAREVKPVRIPVETERPGAAGLAALILPLLAGLRQMPQKLGQKWPTISQPVMGVGLSMIGALVLLLSVGMMTAVGASVLSGIQERSAASRAVTVETTEGIVEIMDTDGRWRPLGKGETVTSNFRVRTGDNSTAKIIFADGQVASLGPNSEVLLAQLQRQTALDATITGTVTVTSTKTVTPTVTMTVTATITPTPTLTPTETPDGFITICHKPGTPAEQTKIIPAVALRGHLGHGDTLGACIGLTPTMTATVSATPTSTLTVTPTSTVTVTPTSTATATGTPESFVTICHKPGTPAEQTKTIPISALNGHLGHGDTMGSCPEDTPVPTPVPGVTPTPTPAPPAPSGDGNITICHKPGTPAQKTMVVSQSALNGHLGHGDTIGACS